MLLQKEYTKRLGYNSIEELKSHEMFENTDWGMVESKNMIPPFEMSQQRYKSAQAGQFWDLDGFNYTAPQLLQNFDKNLDQDFEKMKEIKKKLKAIKEKFKIPQEIEIFKSGSVYCVSCPVDGCKSKGVKGIKAQQQQNNSGFILFNFERHLTSKHQIEKK